MNTQIEIALAAYLLYGSISITTVAVTMVETTHDGTARCVLTQYRLVN